MHSAMQHPHGKLILHHSCCLAIFLFLYYCTSVQNFSYCSPPIFPFLLFSHLPLLSWRIVSLSLYQGQKIEAKLVKNLSYQKCHWLQKLSTNQHYFLFWVPWDSCMAVKLSYAREENTWVHKTDGRRTRRDRNIKQQWKSELPTILIFSLLSGCLPQNTGTF